MWPAAGWAGWAGLAGRATTYDEAQVDRRDERVSEARYAHHPPLEAAEAGPAPVKEVVECQGAHVGACTKGGPGGREGRW